MDVDIESDVWLQLPDSVLLIIFGYLHPCDILRSSQTCRHWNMVACDELLWKDLFHRMLHVHPSVPLAPGRCSWLTEFKRVSYHVPLIESEVLTEHNDQVLHVAFSHKGDMFATSSKDGTVKVWTSTYPATLKFTKDMRQFTWKYTQYSQFNDSDTLLLVSGVHFGSNSTSGEIAVFSLQDFELQCRVMNKPYDIFGTWYNDTHLLSGNLHWIGDLSSCSALWLNKAYQDIESEHESVVMRILKFLNTNASSIRTIMVAPCPNDGTLSSANTQLSSPSTSFGEQFQFVGQDQLKGQRSAQVMDSEGEHINAPIEYDEQYRLAEGAVVDQNAGEGDGRLDANLQELFELEQNHPINLNFHKVYYEKTRRSVSDSQMTRPREPTIRTLSVPENLSESLNAMTNEHAAPFQQLPTNCSTQESLATLSEASSYHTCKTSASNWDMRDKYLIYTMGVLTYTPHLIGIKKIRYVEAAQKMGLRLSGNTESLPPVEENRQMLDRAVDEYDTADYTIELNGHIIGMCLSPDHRYLYVNCRTWPKNYKIDDPLNPPPIAQEIDIHVIDLVSMKEVGTMHRAHKAFTPNDECFFIFLDVCKEYVASGAEDRHGYLWDRHYGICLAKYAHTDVVNSVAFNPRDSEVLISVSDDNKIKVWRSKNRDKDLCQSIKHEYNTETRTSVS